MLFSNGSHSTRSGSEPLLVGIATKESPITLFLSLNLQTLFLFPSNLGLSLHLAGPFRSHHLRLVNLTDSKGLRKFVKAYWTLLRLFLFINLWFGCRERWRMEEQINDFLFYFFLLFLSFGFWGFWLLKKLGIFVWPSWK